MHFLAGLCRKKINSDSKAMNIASKIFIFENLHDIKTLATDSNHNKNFKLMTSQKS